MRGIAAIDAWFDHPNDGRIKMWITTAALRLRQARAQLFERGGYQPLALSGAKAANAFAFARPDGDSCVIAVVGRFFSTLGGARPTGTVWGNTHLELPPALHGRRWRDPLTGQVFTPEEPSLFLDALFAHLPVALLETVP
jgi:(1->4)-alpha-D-glucan 1-alpha-D-glucosylmutase